MDIAKVTVLNLENGQVGVIRRSLFESPVFNVGQLVEVEDGQKPYHPVLWKPRTAEEWEAGHRDAGDLEVFAPDGFPIEDALKDVLETYETTEEKAD